MKQILLTQNKYALVDDEDYQKLNQYSWHCHTVKRRYYYAHATIKGIEVQMASMVMNLPKKCTIIHLDKNGLNNQKSNLRIVTVAQRNQNRIKTTKKTSSQYKGVYLDGQKWIARITINKKRKHLGRFNNELEAAQAYDKAAIQYFGEFAQLNLETYDEFDS